MNYIKLSIYVSLAMGFGMPADVFAQPRTSGGSEIGYSNRASYPISMEAFITAGIAIGDIDGDGDNDMIEANGRHWAQANYVYLNADNRGLSSRYQLEALERTSYAVKLADLDNDGDLDIVQASDKMQNQVFFNDGAGQFGAAHLFGTVNSNTRSIEVADLNGDGSLDILEISRGTPNLIYLNDGAGGFATPPGAMFGPGSELPRSRASSPGSEC